MTASFAATTAGPTVEAEAGRFAVSAGLLSRETDMLLGTVLGALAAAKLVGWVLVESDVARVGDPHVRDDAETVVIGDRVARLRSSVDVASAASLHRTASTGYPLNAWWFRPQPARGHLQACVRAGRLSDLQDHVIAYCTSAFDAEAYLLMSASAEVDHVLRAR